MVAAASAAPITMSCAYVDGTPTTGNRDVFINQIIIDPDKPMITIRVAQTIGTTAPWEWVYDDVNGNSLVVTGVKDGSFAASALRAGSVASFIYAKASGVLIWSFSTRYGGEAYRFNCRP
ncbi:hypothetical protein DWF00_28935 [Bosea caraganae]|uniref:Uncharacterized protein n=1 Tax=Bosea caraganae TaxID=2763117 RepID=A0A370L2P9_9HYPH|nr:hypothetical protein [Bosea caraganae]RDJ20958.1 hypothetical protein DWF00_28935 [Bosea caraganae]RDJ22508.1 hypothetical protein DWE98_18890 [Bosea caraganae]